MGVTPMGHFAGVASSTKVISQAEENLPEVQFVDKAGTTVIVDNVCISLPEVGEAVRECVHEWATIVDNRLLLQSESRNAPMFAFETDLSKWRCEPANVTPGYGIFNDKRNDISNHDRTLLTHLVTHPSVRGMFHYVHNGALVWKRGMVKEFLAAAELAEKYLCAAIHMSYGQPARATEEVPLTLVNSQTGTGRTVHISHEYVVLLFRYHKMNELVRAPTTSLALDISDVSTPSADMTKASLVLFHHASRTPLYGTTASYVPFSGSLPRCWAITTSAFAWTHCSSRVLIAPWTARRWLGTSPRSRSGVSGRGWAIGCGGTSCPPGVVTITIPQTRLSKATTKTNSEVTPPAQATAFTPSVISARPVSAPKGCSTTSKLRAISTSL